MRNLRRGSLALKDSSLFYYGKLYHKLFDPQLAESRERIINLVAEDSSVLEIACGTGELCFSLRERKNCRVVGIDLSRRMLRFAESSRRAEDIQFIHGDGTDLSRFGDRSFDYATILVLIHELSRESRLRVLGEALRVAGTVIVVDAKAPLPRNAGGLGIRFVEATFGRSHHRQFRDFLARGGIPDLLKDLDAPPTVFHRSVFWRESREIVAVGRAAQA